MHLPTIARIWPACAGFVVASAIGLVLVGHGPGSPSFAAAPPASWWDPSYGYRAELAVTAGPNTPFNGYAGYSVSLTIDSASLVGQGKLQSDCDDLRLAFWSGATWIELDRDIYGCDSAQTEVWFASQADIPASSADDNYYLYYGNPAATAGPADRGNVYLHYNDWSTNRLSEYSIGRQDDWHGTGAYTGFAWDAANGRISFDTGDNFTGGLRLNGFGERDLYVEQAVAYTGCYPNDVTQGPMARYLGDGTSSNNWYAFVQADSTGCAPGAYTNPAMQKDLRTGSGICGVVPSYSPWPLDGVTHRQAFAVWGVNPTNLEGWLDRAPRKPSASPDLTCADASASDHENAGDVAWTQAQSRGWLDDLLARRYT